MTALQPGNSTLIQGVQPAELSDESEVYSVVAHPLVLA